ncbi:MAG: antibiotic biosynthesis monooxygenase (ABM) superfamily enzyme, partial [Gammaproteobacteria bacterium]
MIKVIIERFVAEGLEEYYEKAIGDLLNVMTAFTGYVSGESLVEIHRP